MNVTPNVRERREQGDTIESEGKFRFWAMAGMVLLAAAARVIPHPPNFTPVAAMALFGGAYFRPAWAFAAPLLAMFLSDLALEGLFGWGFHAGMPVVYAAFALTVCLGFLLRGKRTLWSVAAASLSASTLFFVVTNFAVWLGDGAYPRTIPGLAACYAAAIPFFGPTLAGDLFYTGALFSLFAFLERKIPAFKAVPILRVGSP